jgi:hypothetical protein
MICRVLLSEPALMFLFKENATIPKHVVEKGIPEDARLVHCFMHPTQPGLAVLDFDVGGEPGIQERSIYFVRMDEDMTRDQVDATIRQRTG